MEQSSLLFTACVIVAGAMVLYAVASRWLRGATDPEVSVVIDEEAGTVTVTVSELDAPQSYGVRLDQFVVWTVDRAREPQRVAALTYDPAGRSGVAEVALPRRQFALLVSAERSGRQAGKPSGPVLIERHVSNRHSIF